jgi:hypothetical protein
MPHRARTTSRIASAATAALAPLVALAVTAATAVAAPYTIDTCGATGSAGDWQPFGTTSTAFLQTGHDCPAANPGPDELGEATRTGLWVTDTLASSSDTPQGAEAGQQIDAPAGATIARAELWRIEHKNDDNGWRMFFKLGRHDDPTVPEQDDCTIFHVECAVGGWSWGPGNPNSDSYTDLTGLSTSAISFGVRCAADADFPCMNGFDFFHVGISLYEARLTLNDPSAPPAPSGGGSAWTSGDWLRGDQQVDVSGDDPQDGITATRIYIDGQLADGIDHRDTSACDWTRVHPCDAADDTLTIDTMRLADGEHQLAIADVNAAGVETRTTRPTPLRVDNHAPTSPVALTATRIGATNTFSISWQLPADSGSPFAAAHWQLCAPACGPVHDADTLQQINSLTLPSAADGQLHVTLADELGQENLAAAATVALPYLAPPPPPARRADDGGPTVTTPVVTTPVVTTPSDPTQPSGDAGQISTSEDPSPGGSGSDNPTPSEPAQAAAKRAAALRLSSLQRTATTVTLRGSIARAAVGKVTITLVGRAGAHTVRRSAAASIRGGRWTVRVMLPRAIRGRAVTLTVRYGGSSDVLANSFRRTVKRR